MFLLDALPKLLYVLGAKLLCDVTYQTVFMLCYSVLYFW